MKKLIFTIIPIAAFIFSQRAAAKQIPENGWPVYFTLASHYIWSGGTWVKDMRLTPTYNSGRIDFILGESPSGNSWNNEMKLTMTYDEEGKAQTRGILLYQDNAWVEFSTDTFKYDGEDFTQTRISYRMAGGAWTRFNLDHYTYNDNDQLVEILQEDISTSTGDWENDDDYLYAYDIKGNLTTIVNNDWNGTKWVSKRMDNISFNSGGAVADIVSLDTSGNSWVNAEKLVFDGSSSGLKQAVSNDFRLSVYPNPGQSELKVNMPAVQSPVQLGVYDLQGRLLILQQQFVERNTVTIDIRTLPKGSYLLRCISEAGQGSSSFVKE